MEEDYRVKYAKSLNNVLNQLGWKGKELISDEDESILHQLVGHLYMTIETDGRMTKDLAEGLGCLHLWEKGEERRRIRSDSGDQ